jgi:hypothetical protein
MYKCFLNYLPHPELPRNPTSQTGKSFLPISKNKLFVLAVVTMALGGSHFCPSQFHPFILVLQNHNHGGKGPTRLARSDHHWRPPAQTLLTFNSISRWIAWHELLLAWEVDFVHLKAMINKTSWADSNTRENDTIAGAGNPRLKLLLVTCVHVVHHWSTM